LGKKRGREGGDLEHTKKKKGRKPRRRKGTRPCSFRVSQEKGSEGEKKKTRRSVDRPRGMCLSSVPRRDGAGKGGGGKWEKKGETEEDRSSSVLTSHSGKRGKGSEGRKKRSAGALFIFDVKEKRDLEKMESPASPRLYGPLRERKRERRKERGKKKKGGRKDRGPLLDLLAPVGGKGGGGKKRGEERGPLFWKGEGRRGGNNGFFFTPGGKGEGQVSREKEGKRGGGDGRTWQSLIFPEN